MKEFLKYKARVEKLCKECKTSLSESNDKEVKKLYNEIDSFLKEYKEQKKLTLAFIGQYNAGKSTLIKALTGDPAVKIGADITTDRINPYLWKGILLLDTPGVYAGRPDLDETSEEQITKSDLLVFVITNELFNPQLATFFEWVMTDQQRTGQLLLVVNKMSRETGHPEELLNYLRRNFKESDKLKSYQLENFYICFVDAQLYLDGEKEDSRFDDFLAGLDDLIKKNKLTFRLTTPLHKAEDTLERAEQILSTEDRTTRDLLEFLRRKGNYLKASKIKLQNRLYSSLNKLETDIRMQVESVVELVDGNHSREEIDKRISLVNGKDIPELLSKTHEEIQSLAEDEMKRLQEEIEALDASPLGTRLDKEVFIKMPDPSFDPKYPSTAENKRSTFVKLQPLIEKGKCLPLAGLTINKNTVYTIGKFVGFKFKPYGATKIAVFMGKIGPIINVIASILEIFVTLKEEEERKKEEQRLNQEREKLRRTFRDGAARIVEDFKKNIKDGINYYEEELNKVEKIKNDVMGKEREKSEYLKNLSCLLGKIKATLSKLTAI